MQTHTAESIRSETNPFDQLLDAYRFRACQTPEEAAEALEVRRQVYCVDAGYAIPCPDEYDHRSWILRADDLRTGRCIGTMRLTPRLAGPFEAEEYFELPRELRGAMGLEISRFAILPEYRKDKTLVPAVSFGLFRLCYDFALAIGARYEIVCSKPERTWTYTSMGFLETGITAEYTKLAGAVHELLRVDFREAVEFLRDNPFKALFLDAHFPEVIVPNRRPPLGLVPDTREFRFAVGA
jgi:N-acyl amino acid synthase FeeM